MKTLLERQTGWCELTWKRFFFAVGHHLYEELKKRSRTHYTDKLYECAKHHAGQKSLVFPPTAGKVRDHRKEDGVAKYTRLFLMQSLENYEASYLPATTMFHNMWNVYYYDFKILMHEGRLQELADDVEFKHAAVESHSQDTLLMAQAYYEDGDPGRLAIIADGLLDDGDVAGSEHLRRGLHSPACVVIQGIIRRL